MSYRLEKIATKKMKSENTILNPFNDDDLNAMLTPQTDMPSGVTAEHLIPFDIRKATSLTEADQYQFALLTYSILITAGVDLYEFQRLAEDPEIWAKHSAYKSFPEGAEYPAGVFYLNVFDIDSNYANKSLRKLQTIRLIATSLKMCRFEIADYVDLVEQILEYWHEE